MNAFKSIEGIGHQGFAFKIEHVQPALAEEGEARAAIRGDLHDIGADQNALRQLKRRLFGRDMQSQDAGGFFVYELRLPAGFFMNRLILKNKTRRATKRLNDGPCDIARTR
jgi:hypothetical protein